MSGFLRTYVWTPLIAAILLCIFLPLGVAVFGQQLLLLGVGGPFAAGLPAITSATTYYVCAKANGGTCAYNGDGGTVAPTISDSNACTTKAAPCATIAGAKNKFAANALSAVVTVQLADTAGTGSDCYQPTDVIFDNVIFGTDPIDSWEQANGTTLQYPRAYVYLHGNDTTPGNVLVSGVSGACTGSTPSADAGVRFDHTNGRVRGIAFQYFGAGSQAFGGAIVPVNSTMFIEDVNYTAPSTGATSMIMAYRKSYVVFGSSVGISITNGYVIQMFGFSSFQTISPLGRANFTVADSQSANLEPAIFTAADNSWMQWDGASLTVTGTATTTVWSAIDHSGINWSDASTFTAPTQTISINGSNFTTLNVQRGSYANDLCRTAGSLVCNIGNTTAVAFRAKADTLSFVAYNTAGSGVSNIDVAASNSTIISGSSRTLFGLNATTFANLASPANGVLLYCSDCTSPSNPATGSSTGALCMRQNAVWKCF